MINVLVTGSNGQVGSEIKSLVDEQNEHSRKYRYFFTNKDSLDITQKESINKYVENNNIKVIVNCAAYTAVDKAEDEKKIADLVNNKAVKYLAQISKIKDVQLIHISTDYVFDGTSTNPYTEYDIPNPQSVYGKTKRFGEKALLDINPRNSIIIRTSWVYSHFGNNFVSTMLKLGNTKDEIGVVSDQLGSPTYAKDLAKTILEVFPKISNNKVELYHYANEGGISWYDFAKEIMYISELNCKIKALSTNEYPTSAKRPTYSVLSNRKIVEDFSITIPHWKDSLNKYFHSLG